MCKAKMYFQFLKAQFIFENFICHLCLIAAALVFHQFIWRPSFAQPSETCTEGMG